MDFDYIEYTDNRPIINIGYYPKRPRRKPYLKKNYKIYNHFKDKISEFEKIIFGLLGVKDE